MFETERQHLQRVRNYLLVYERKSDGKIFYNYFETKEDMKDFIKVNIGAKAHWKIHHKYKIEEIR